MFRPCSLLDGQRRGPAYFFAAFGEAETVVVAVSNILCLHTLTAITFCAQGGETVDYIGAVRVFGVADKMLFEQLVQLDKTNMSL